MVDTVITAGGAASSSCVAPSGPSVRVAVAPVSVDLDSVPAPGGRGVEEGLEGGRGAVTYGHRSSPC